VFLTAAARVLKELDMFIPNSSRAVLVAAPLAGERGPRGRDC
jgi:hypothetical protein